MKKYISMEGFRPQLNDWFPKQLLGVIQRIYLDMSQDVNISNQSIIKTYGKEIHDLIEKRFGVNVIMDPYLWAATPMGIFCFSTLKLGDRGRGVPDSFTNVPSAGDEIDDKFIDGYLEALDNFTRNKDVEAKKYDGATGTVDFEKLRVTGYMSKVTNILAIDFLTLYSKIKITEEEMVAMILHEIGHPFTSFAFEVDLIGTNQIIEQCSKEIEKGNMEKAVYIYRSNFGEEDLKKSLSSRSLTKEVFYSKLVARYTNVYQSHYGSGTTDSTQSEVLADTFAVAFGYAGYLATGLKKFNEVGELPSYGIGFSLLRTSLSIAVLVGVIVTTPALVLATVPGLALTLTFLAAETHFKAVADVNALYDNESQRFIRMRQQSIALLKTPNADKDQVREVLKSIDLLEQLSKEAKDPGSSAATLKSLLSSSFRRKVNQRERQQKIESLLNNDLFALNQKLLTM